MSEIKSFLHGSDIVVGVEITIGKSKCVLSFDKTIYLICNGLLIKASAECVSIIVDDLNEKYHDKGFIDDNSWGALIHLFSI